VADVFEVVYTPSFSLLHCCAVRKRDGSGEVLLVESHKGELHFATVECAMVGKRLGRAAQVKRLMFSEAKLEAIQAAAGKNRVLHYSGHASFDRQHPLDSELSLCDNPLRLGDLFACLRLPLNQLTVLNGCESGLLDPELLDDYCNFTTGFLFAGAPCVVSTLWAICDLPSALLIDKFYQEWSRAQPPAAALRLAQKWLRELRAGAELDRVVEEFTCHLSDPVFAKNCKERATKLLQELGERPFASPVYWAAFICSGKGYTY